MKEEVEHILATEIRPMLEHDGGGIELIGVDEASGEVRVKLIGACHGCPFAAITLKTRVEDLLKQKIPGITKIIAVE
ncbi:MAG: NifU family protein [Patescibacteria group bacterium]|jgi:Fe-S cluster biogenesis protein NfuA